MSVITGVVDVAFKRAAPDEEIAYDGRVAVGESELMKVLLDGIARETVAYGQYRRVRADRPSTDAMARRTSVNLSLMVVVTVLS